MMNCRKNLLNGLIKPCRLVFNGDRAPTGADTPPKVPKVGERNPTLTFADLQKAEQRLDKQEADKRKASTADKLSLEEADKVKALTAKIAAKEQKTPPPGKDTAAAYAMFKDKYKTYETLSDKKDDLAKDREKLVTYLREILMKSSTDANADKALVAAYKKEDAAKEKAVAQKAAGEKAEDALLKDSAQLAKFKAKLVPDLLEYADNTMKYYRDLHPGQNLLADAKYQKLDDARYWLWSMHETETSLKSITNPRDQDLANEKRLRLKPDADWIAQYKKVNSALVNIGAAEMHFNQALYEQPVAVGAGGKGKKEAAKTAPPAVEPKAPPAKPPKQAVPPPAPRAAPAPRAVPAPGPLPVAKATPTVQPAAKPPGAVAKAPATPAAPAAAPPRAVAKAPAPPKVEQQKSVAKKQPATPPAMAKAPDNPAPKPATKNIPKAATETRNANEVNGKNISQAEVDGIKLQYNKWLEAKAAAEAAANKGKQEASGTAPANNEVKSEYDPDLTWERYDNFEALKKRMFDGAATPSSDDHWARIINALPNAVSKNEPMKGARISIPGAVDAHAFTNWRIVIRYMPRGPGAPEGTKRFYVVPAPQPPKGATEVPLDMTETAEERTARLREAAPK